MASRNLNSPELYTVINSSSLRASRRILRNTLNIRDLSNNFASGPSKQSRRDCRGPDWGRDIGRGDVSDVYLLSESPHVLTHSLLGICPINPWLSQNFLSPTTGRYRFLFRTTALHRNFVRFNENEIHWPILLATSSGNSSKSNNLITYINSCYMMKYVQFATKENPKRLRLLKKHRRAQIKNPGVKMRQEVIFFFSQNIVKTLCLNRVAIFCVKSVLWFFLFLSALSCSVSSREMFFLMRLIALFQLVSSLDVGGDKREDACIRYWRSPNVSSN